MHVAEILSRSRPVLSFEFFPPKTDSGWEALYRTISEFAPLEPGFVSVTYGAGGSTRERTHGTIARMLRETSLTPAAHLTCVGATKAETDEVVQGYWNEGVRHIVALRGDPVTGAGTKYVPHPGGYEGSPELIQGIKKIGNFEVSVSAYPEKHPDSASMDAELDLLKRKVDAGANRAITQFFFGNDLYFRFLDRVRARGIDIPVVPGIIPVLNFAQVKKFADACGAHVPNSLAERFAGLEHDAETRKLVAATVAAEQVSDLRQRGVNEFHFYTLNRSELVFAICHMLGIRPETGAAAA